MDGYQPRPLSLRSCIIPVEQITADPGAPLGKSTSTVFQGTWNNALVAIKRLPSDTLPEALHSRIQLWESLKHSHVLEIFGASPADADPLFIVMQYHGYGSATQFLEQNPSADRSKILYETALGMQYIHDRGLVHGSLKPSNILITNYQQAVVADCAMCEITPSVNSASSQYFSPEAWKGATSRGADIYAFAMSALEIFQSKLPWGVLSESKIYQFVVKENERPDRPEPDTDGRELIVDEVWSLMEKCWRKDSRSRPSFNKILEVWPKPDPALTPLPPSNTDSPVSSASPAQPSLIEPEMRDLPDQPETRPRADSLEDPHGPPAYEEAPQIVTAPVVAQRVQSIRLPPASPPHSPSGRALPPAPLALDGNTNLNRGFPRDIKVPYNPNTPNPTTVRRFSESPPTSSAGYTTNSNRSSPRPVAYPTAGGSGPSSSSGTSRNSYTQRTFSQARDLAPQPPSVLAPPSQYSPGLGRRSTMQSVSSIDESQASSSFEPSFQNLQVSGQPALAPMPAYEYSEQLPSPSPRFAPRYIQPSERTSDYGGSVSAGSNPSVTGGTNALLLAQALHVEVTEGRDPNIINDHLVRLYRFAIRSEKDAQRLVTAGVVPDMINLLRVRAVDFNGLDIVLVALGTLAQDSVTANMIYRVGAASTLMELLSSSLSNDIAAGSVWCLARICRSTEVASGLIKQGMIKVLMEKGLVNGTEMTSRLSAWCLGTLIRTDSFADTMAAQGLVPLAVNNLLKQAGSQNATGGDISAATYLIARLARSIKLSKSLAKAGAIQPLVHALKTSEDPQVLDWSARAIGCLMRPNSSDMSKLLLDAGAAIGLARLPRVLADHEIDPLGSFAFAIQRFSVAEWGSGTRKALVDAGVVDSLLAALRTAADVPYPQVHIELALAVSFLGDVGGGEIRKEIIRAGGIDILKKVGAAGAPDVQKACNMAVTSITGNLWTRNAASAKTALSHEWNGGAPVYVPPMPAFSTAVVEMFEGYP